MITVCRAFFAKIIFSLQAEFKRDCCLVQTWFFQPGKENVRSKIFLFRETVTWPNPCRCWAGLVASNRFSVSIDVHVSCLLLDRIQSWTTVYENEKSFRLEQLDENLQFDPNCLMHLARYESFSTWLLRWSALEVQTCTNSRWRDNRQHEENLQVLLVVHLSENVRVPRDDCVCAAKEKESSLVPPHLPPHRSCDSHVDLPEVSLRGKWIRNWSYQLSCARHDVFVLLFEFFQSFQESNSVSEVADHECTNCPTRGAVPSLLPYDC